MQKRDAWKVDYAARAKVSCFLCDYASSKGSHLKRHYTEVHGYDLSEPADSSQMTQVGPDPEDPDGHLCPECGQHYQNKKVLVRHMLKKHSTPKGDLCPYCDFR